MSQPESVVVPRKEYEELSARYKIGAERSWALSVFLAHIRDEEVTRIARKLSIEDNRRLEAAILTYAPDLAASLPSTQQEEQK